MTIYYKWLIKGSTTYFKTNQIIKLTNLITNLIILINLNKTHPPPQTNKLNYLSGLFVNLNLNLYNLKSLNYHKLKNLYYLKGLNLNYLK